MQNLFPPRVVTCVPPFEQLAESEIAQPFFCLHPFLFTFWFALNMLEVICGVGCEHLVINSPIIPFFRLHSNVFSTTLHIRLGLSHPLILGVSHCIYNQPLDFMGSTFLGRGTNWWTNLPWNQNPCLLKILVKFWKLQLVYNSLHWFFPSFFHI